MKLTKTEVWYKKVKGIIIRIRWEDFIKADTVIFDGFQEEKRWQECFFQLMSLKNTYSEIKELTITPEAVVKMVVEGTNNIKKDEFIEYIQNIYCGCKVSVSDTEFLKVALDDLLYEQDCYECYVIEQ